MQAVTKIKDILGKRPSHYIPSTMDFIEIDLDHLIDKMKLKDVAQERGAREQPHTNAQDLDNIETNIIHEIEAIKCRDYATLLNELRAYDDRIAALSLDNKIFEIKGVSQNAIVEFNAEVRKGELRLARKLQQAQEIRQERIDFRAKNKLTRTADHPESSIFCISIIIVLLLFETSMNAFFLAVGQELGFMGGFFVATFIAFINVIVAVAVGNLALPLMYHIRGFLKVLGWMALLVYLSIACGFNLLVAHYRLALSKNQPELADMAAIQSFLANPINLSDFQSLIMVCGGFIFSLIAAWEGLKMNDRYPGFSKLERRYDSALLDYSQSQVGVIDNLRKIKDTAIKEMREYIYDLSSCRSEFASILANRQRLINSFEQRIYYLQNCVRYVISVYRDANITARSSNPPVYFNDSYIMQHPGRIETPARLSEEQAKIENAIGDSTTELDKANEKMHAEFIAVQDSFPLLREIIGKM